MKKLYVLIVAVSAMVAISGCADKPTTSNSSQPLAEPSSATALPSSSLPPTSSVAEPSEDSQWVLDKDLIYELYGKDIFDSAVASQTWDDATQIRPEFLVNFFSNKTELYRLSTDAEPVFVPAELLESFVQLHFNVEAEHIRKSIYYNKDDNTYGLPIYSAGASTAQIVEAVLTDHVLTVWYKYFGPENNPKPFMEGIFKIEMIDRWYYKYISCEVTDLKVTDRYQ